MKKKLLSITIFLLLISGLIPSVNSIEKQGKSLSAHDDFECYGFIVEVNSSQSYVVQINISRLVNSLLEQNISVYWSCSNLFIISDDLYIENNTGVRLFEKGCFVIPFSIEPALNAKIAGIIFDYSLNKELNIFKIKQPLNNIEVYSLKKPKIAYYSSPAGDFYHYYKALKEGGFKNHNFLTHEDIINGKLTEDLNVYIHGGGWIGGYAFLLGAGDLISAKAAMANIKIKKFIENGGGYVGSCGGLSLAASGARNPPCFPPDMGSVLMKFLPSYSQLGIIDMPIHIALPGATGDMFNPGTGVDIKIVNPDNPVSFGLPEIIENHEYMCGPMFLEKKVGSTNAEPLGIIENVDKNDLVLEDWSMSVFPWWKNNLLSDKYKNSLIDKYINCSIGQALWATSEYGKGKAVAFGGHPECGDAPRIVYNAVFYAASEGPTYISIDNGKNISNNNLYIDAPSEGNISEQINFYAKITRNNEPEYWVWNFGDDQKSFEQNSTHVYHEYNEYRIILTASNKNNIFVSNSSINILGNLQVNTESYYIFNNASTIFTSSSNGGFKPYIWYWNFGDGNISNDKSPIHSYEDIGAYFGNVTVRDRYENSANCPFIVAVNKESPKHNATFNNSLVDRGNINEKIKFTADINCSQKFLKFNFSFGDDTYHKTGLIEVNNFSVNHSYAKSGVYYPTVTISDASDIIYVGCNKVYINTPPDKPVLEPIAEVQIGDSSIDVGESFLFSITVSDQDKDKMYYRINWGAETYNYSHLSLNSGETHILRDIRMVEGKYTVKVKSIDMYGAESEWSCLNTTVEKGYVYKEPLVLFLRFLLKHPNSFPVFRMFFSTEIFEY